jgi:hypothetical protein
LKRFVAFFEDFTSEIGYKKCFWRIEKITAKFGFNYSSKNFVNFLGISAV